MSENAKSYLCRDPQRFGYSNAKCSYEVRYCQSPETDMWTWGHQYDGPTFGGGGLPLYHTNDPDAPHMVNFRAFQSEKECIYDCLCWLQRQFEKQGKSAVHYNEDGSLFSNFKSEIKDILKHIAGNSRTPCR